MPGSTCCNSCRDGTVSLNYAYRRPDYRPPRGARTYPKYKPPHMRTYVKHPATRPTNKYDHHTDWHNRYPAVSFVQYKTHGSYSGR